jgi:tRNA pseudouridine55 synthase
VTDEPNPIDDIAVPDELTALAGAGTAATGALNENAGAAPDEPSAIAGAAATDELSTIAGGATADEPDAIAGRAATERRPRRIDSGLDGILVVDKPVGPTSHDVVALVRRLAGTKRIGHGGTLDPFASGVLPLYLGLGTRVVEFHLGARKAYRATVCFGASSTTDDLEGELRPIDAPAPTREIVEAALAGFLGTHLQLPPAFSARKVGGRRAYALARAGHAPELPAREATFFALSLERWDETDPDQPLAVIDVACSAGTYVRALARDLGTAVGSGAYLAALRRTAAGPFTLDDAITLDVVRDAAANGRFASLLHPVGTGLDDLPAVTLRPDELVVVAHGGWIGEGGRLPAPPATGAGVEPATNPPMLDRVRLLFEDGSLAAIARRAGGRLVPDKVLVPRAGIVPHA